jgi:hypothetical protein
MQTKPFHSVSLRILILFSPCKPRPSGHFPSYFLTKPQYVFLFPAARATNPLNLVFLYQITRKQCDEDKRSSPVPLLLTIAKENIAVERYPFCTSQVKCLGAFAKLRKATISFVMTVCPSACENSAPTGRIFMKFDI